MNPANVIMAIFLSGLSLMFAGCAVKKPLVDENMIGKSLPPAPVSQFNIPVRAYVKPFMVMAEQMAPKEILSEGWPNYYPSGCDFRYKYRFVRNNMQFTCTNNSITLNIYGAYQVAGSKTVCVMGQPISPWVSGSCGFGNEPLRKVTISMRTDLALQPDYTIRTITRVNKVTPADRCLVTILNTDITAMITDSIAASSRAFGQSLDQSIAAMRFDNLLLPIAEKVGKKIPMAGYGYMNLNPAAVSVSPINYSNDTLNFVASLACYPLLGSDSTNHTRTTSLPPLKNGNIPEGINLTVNAVYDYKTIDSILTTTLRNRVFETNGEKIAIEKVSVKGLDHHQVEFRIDFKGTKKGTIYLKGTPILDRSNQVLLVPDLDYDLNSSNLSLTIGKTFFNRKIIALLREKARVNVADMYRKNKAMLDSSLNRTVVQGVQIKGNTSDLRLNALVIDKDHVSVQANATGKATLIIGRLN